MLLDFPKLKRLVLHSYEMYLKEKEDKTVNWFQNDIVDGYTFEEGDTFYIVFRGTDDEKEEQANNYRYTKTRVPYNGTKEAIQVHTGFIDIYDTPEVRLELHKRMIDFIERTEKPKLIVTGHSQGAAQTILCAVDLQYNFGDKLIDIVSVPMAPPRVGNKAFADSYNKRVPKTYCIWYGWDIVPRVPLWTMGFRRVGKKIQFVRRSVTFGLIGNFIVGGFRMLINRRKPIYIKYQSEPTRGSDWNFFDDHSPHKYPDFIINTDTLTRDKTYISRKEIEKVIG